MWQQMLDQSGVDMSSFNNSGMMAGEGALNNLLHGDLELGQFFVSGA